MSERRGTRTERGYSNRWLRYRKHFLIAHPLCVYCQRQGRLTPATVVDHIVPHKGDQALFWDTANHQSLCTSCHNSTKQREEKTGYHTIAGVDGLPVDPNHPVNRKRHD